MPVALHSWIVEKDGGIRVRHTFFAETEEEAPDAEALEDFEEDDLDDDGEEDEEE
jgi:hypothetical protein